MRINNEMQNISEYFGVDKQTLVMYYNNGWEMPELRRGAFLAYASHKSFDNVMNLRENNSWGRVEYLIGLTPNDLKATQDDIISTQIANRLDINKSIVTFLVKQNYEVDEVIHGIHPPTSNWEVVADDLGITQEELDEIHQKMETLDLGMIKDPKGPGAMRF